MPEAKIEQRLARLANKRRPVVAAAALFSLGICLILVALAAWSIYSSRQLEQEGATVETTNMAQALAAQAETSFKLADAILEDVTERIRTDGLGGAAAERLRNHLSSTVKHVPELHALFVYGPDGQWLVNSLSYAATGNNADRAYFRYHMTHRDLGTHVGAPVRSRSTNVWIIPVSRRLEKAPFFERHGFRPVARKEVPPAIRNTREFKQLCPASAQVMARPLSNPDGTPC